MAIDDPSVFTDFARNTFGITNQRTIDVITNFVESFGEFIAVNDEYIDAFVKDTNYAYNPRAAKQRILISNNVTKGLKFMVFELKDR